MGRSAPLRSVRMGFARFVVASLASIAPALAAGPVPVAVDQGPDWTPANRDAFYVIDQGSRIMPLRWIKALKLPDGRPFMVDDLKRYGFLANDASPDALPVGFTATEVAGQQVLGMNCAACHTRQIEFGGITYRIDGGPAIMDFQAFLSDINIAVGAVVNDAKAFADFASAVLGATHTPADETALRSALGAWHHRYDTMMVGSLPKKYPWGRGRLDALGMIFNRLNGLDLGTGPDHIIPENILQADAPVRYPFLWNAANQDVTQWPGFAPNTDPSLRLLRNFGQVLGVFADFHPERNGEEINYWAVNSADIRGLLALENLTTRMSAPRWPWALDEALAAKGKIIFDRDCASTCHGSGEGAPPWTTKITKIEEVKTDSRQLKVYKRQAFSGVLEGAKFPFDVEKAPLEKSDTVLRILKNATTGSLFSIPHRSNDLEPFDLELAKISHQKAFMPPSEHGYEARVLSGVWAAAPYLHNGSVPTLAELLKPAAERKPSFKIGSAYDPVAVGLAPEQSQFSATLITTDCSEQDSGNSRCGHDYGTLLSEADKRALLEYLKKL
jgi:hypothetical protein